MKKRRNSNQTSLKKTRGKIFLAMKLTLLLTMFFSFTAFASVSSQSVTLKLENASLRETIKALKNQTGVYFVFNEEEVANLNVKLNMELTDEPFENALSRIFKGLPFTYEYADGVVIIKPTPGVEDGVKLKKVKGRVVDADGEPLPGVSVVVEGTTRGVATDVNGIFQMMIENKVGQKLLFSFIGMEPETVAWNGQDSLHVVMKYLSVGMDEVVVTGYQTLNRRESASAVTTIRAKDILVSGAGSIDKMLQGRIPGMMVMNTSGEPSATPKIRIRGNATINGNKAPVWVVDGVILEQDVPFTASDINSEDAEYLIGNAIAGLNPQDIETITVLKDASATAIYGVKAANGVIVITTKRGGKGAPVITYNGDVTVNTRPAYKNYDRMNSRQRMELSKEIVEAGLNYPRIPAGDSYEGALVELYNKQITQEQFEEKIRVMQARNTDWFDVLFRNAVTHTHNLNVSGGGEKASYYFSAGYNNEQGAAKSSSKERFNTLAKVNVDVNKFIDFQAKIDFSTTTNEGYYSTINPFSYAYQTSRTLPVYNEDGSYHEYNKGSGYNYNIIKELENTGNEAKMNDFNAQVALNVKLWKGLTYGGVFSLSNSTTQQRNWATEESYEITTIRAYEYKAFAETTDEYKKSVLPYGGILNQGETRKTGYTIRNTVNFVRSFDNVHDVNIMGGVEVRSNKYKGHRVTGYGWTPEFGEKFMPVYTERFVSDYVKTGKLNPVNTHTVTQVASFFGTASYTFKNRYVINGNIRSDGANKFGSNPKYRWLPTWSVAGKWIASSENFLRDVTWLNSLAFRGSYGIQGNIHEDATPNLIVTIQDRDNMSGLDKYGIYRLPNPDLRWEKTKSWNVAVDFSLFNNRVKGGFDIFRKNTSDLIMSKSVASSNGRAILYMNAGKMRNAGFEGFINLELVRSDKFDWRFGFNFSRNVNEVTLANGDSYENTDEINMMLAGELAIEGQPVGAMYSYRFAGLSPESGYPLFYAKDGRKVHFGEASMMALKNCGSIFPKLTGGFDTQFTYKRCLSLSLAFAYNIGNIQRLPEVYQDKKKVFDPLSNVSTSLIHRWRKEGDEKYTSVPVLYDDVKVSELKGNENLVAAREGASNLIYPMEMYDKSDERVAKGDFLKLKMVALSYMMPEKYTTWLGISSMTLRLQATNLFTIASKKWEGVDPETPGANIPLLPTYSLGLNISF